jgi:hypothetical protein
MIDNRFGSVVGTHRWCARGGVVGVVLLAVLACAQSGWIEVDPPEGSAAQDIEKQLRKQKNIVPPTSRDVEAVMCDLPDRPGDRTKTRFEPQPEGALPRSGLIGKPPSVLESGGFYLGVRNEGGQFVHLIHLSNPRIIRSEVDNKGILTPEIMQTEGGVIAARIPFEGRGSVVIFETADPALVPRGKVSVVYLDERRPAVMPGK